MKLYINVSMFLTGNPLFERMESIDLSKSFEYIPQKGDCLSVRSALQLTGTMSDEIEDYLEKSDIVATYVKEIYHWFDRNNNEQCMDLRLGKMDEGYERTYWGQK